MIRRQTPQRKMVLDAIKSLCNHPTAEEIFSYLKKENSKIGLGTLYRNLLILEEEGKIIRISFPGSPDRFDHTLSKHAHFKCLKCGRIYDVELNNEVHESKEIKLSDGYLIEDYDIIFKGICPKCQNDSSQKEKK